MNRCPICKKKCSNNRTLIDGAWYCAQCLSNTLAGDILLDWERQKLRCRNVLELDAKDVIEGVEVQNDDE